MGKDVGLIEILMEFDCNAVVDDHAIALQNLDANIAQDVIDATILCCSDTILTSVGSMRGEYIKILRESTSMSDIEIDRIFKNADFAFGVEPLDKRAFLSAMLLGVLAMDAP